MAIPVLSTIGTFIQNYFVAPIWLYALAALIPLILFYLFKPEPDDQLMPSMMFFMKKDKKEEGQIDRAVQFLKKNWLLLLHILLITGIVAAVAQPLIDTEGNPEQTVVIFDRSASMTDNIGQARDFVNQHLSGENTLIIADHDVQVPLEKAAPSSVQNRISDMDAADTQTDIAGALDVAADYDGQIVIASDLDQTVSDRKIKPLLTSLETEGRSIVLMDIDEENEWGIIDMELGENASIDIKNFQDRQADITVNAHRQRTITVDGGSVETLNVPLQEGRNTVELEDDPMTADNTASIYVPPDRQFTVTLIADDEDPYFAKAVELIPFTRLNFASPPVQSNLTADVLVVGETQNLLRRTANRLEERARGGRSLVVYGQESIFSMFDLPVGRTGNSKITTAVSINEPERIYVDQVEMFPVQKTRGEALASNSSIVRADLGEGQILYYGLTDSNFRFDFLYPVFWKSVLQQLTDRTSVQQVNVQTGEEIDGTALTQAGFHDINGQTYAASLLDEDESYAEPLDFQVEEDEQETAKTPIQHHTAALLAILMLAELSYLIYEGVV